MSAQDLRSSLVRLVGAIAVGAVLVAATIFALTPALGDLDEAADVEFGDINLDPLPERSLMYDRNGGLMAALRAEQNRSPVKLADVPPHVVDAILAVEDWDFHVHGGVDLRSTMRALFENVETGGIDQGGSTITMQVVKLSLLSQERTLERKVREAVLAVRLEDQLSKEEILERYLNMVYFGNGAYGVQAAAETYFQTSVQNLTVGQAALLAGIIRDPIDYEPFAHPEVAQERRRIALQRMVSVDLITQPEADQFNVEPLPVAPPQPLVPEKLDYFAEDAKLQLLRDPRFGIGDTPSERYNSVFYGGLRIHTTYDPGLQQAALAARANVLPGNDPNIFTWRYNGADHQGTAVIVSVEPQTGAIRTLVGGPGWDRSTYNIATNPQVRRDNGSSFKIFVLVAALENGLVANDTISGSSPCTFHNPGGAPDPYRLVNFEGGGGGSGSITSQTLRSSNCAYVRLGQVVGIPKVVEQANRMGVSVELPAVPSLPLGVGGVPPIEMAGAMASIANDGIYNEPYYIDRIEDREGNVIYQHEPTGVRVMSQQTSRATIDILEKNVSVPGTGRRARVPNQPAAGKTGTAHDYGNAWFVGATPQLATAVWVGSIGNVIPLRNVPGAGSVTGGEFPAQIWGEYMTAALQGVPEAAWAEPESTRRGRSLRPESEIRTRPRPRPPSTTPPPSPAPPAPPPPPPPEPPPTTIPNPGG